MEIFIKVSQLLLSLTILVFLHELGHFIPAKLFKVRVSKFYVFFDFLFPLPSVLNFSLFKKKVGDTEYGIGWFPLGGYVQIDGMVDESMDIEKLNEPPQPWEFRAKPTWQRLIIMVGGVTVNVIVAMAIYAGMLFVWGKEYLPMKNATNGIWVTDTIAYDMGIKDGDKILSVNGQPVENFMEFTRVLVIENAQTLEINRAGADTIIQIPEGFVSKLISSKSKGDPSPLIMPRIPIEVVGLKDNSGAANAGLELGDRIVGINDVSTIFYDEFLREVRNHKSEEIKIQLVRNSENISLPVQVDEEGVLGIKVNDSIGKYYEFNKIEYGFFESIPAGVSLAVTTLGDYVKQMKLLFNGTAKFNESVGGFASMTKGFKTEWDWKSFWNMTAIISVILAFMNILPIPALDGGHVMFLIYEMIFRKPPPLKFMEYAQMIGMMLLLGLMLYANGLDVFRAFFK